MITLTNFGETSIRPSLTLMTASWKSFAAVRVRCCCEYVFADPRTCTIGTLVSCLLVDAHCFTFYYYFVVVLVDESFMNVLKNRRRIIAGSFRFWRFDSTKSSHKEEFFVVNGFKEQLNLLKRSIFIFELFLEKSSSFLYKNAWKLPLHRAKSFFDIAMSSQVKLITLKVSFATVL